MANVSLDRARNGLELLTGIEVTRQNALERLDGAAQVIDTVEEEYCEAPIIRSYFEAGVTEAILKMTNFILREFKRIYERFEDHITSKWNFLRGKKKKLIEKDVCLC